jgi:hypothetical protein
MTQVNGVSDPVEKGNLSIGIVSISQRIKDHYQGDTMCSS